MKKIILLLGVLGTMHFSASAQVYKTDTGSHIRNTHMRTHNRTHIHTRDTNLKPVRPNNYDNNLNNNNMNNRRLNNNNLNNNKMNNNLDNKSGTGTKTNTGTSTLKNRP